MSAEKQVACKATFSLVALCRYEGMASACDAFQELEAAARAEQPADLDDAVGEGRHPEAEADLAPQTSEEAGGAEGTD